MKDFGLILFPDMQLDLTTKKVNYLSSGVCKKDLISAVTYYDKAIFINSNILHVGIGESKDERILLDEGFLTDYMHSVGFFSGDMFTLIYEATGDAIMTLLREKGDSWVAKSTSDTFINFKGVENSGKGDRLTLINALPLPSQDVEIEDLLEFKLKRKDEHTRLKLAINSIELKVLTSADKEIALRQAINEIDASCYDLIRAYQSSPIKFDFGKMTFNFSIKEISKNMAATYGALQVFSLPKTAEIALTIGSGIQTAIKINDSISLRKIDRASPFIYSAEIATKLN